MSLENGSLIVEWAGSVPAPTLPIEALRPVLRRWDHAGCVEGGGAVAVEPGVEIDVENGIVLRFEEGGRFRAGDYWLIPARPSTGDILWPGAPDCAQAQPPHGPEHHYAPLARLGDGATSDLRRTFGPLSVKL